MPKFDIDEALLRKLAALLNETGLTEIEYENAGQRVRVAGRIENPLLPGRYFVSCLISRNRSGGDLALHVLRLLDFVVYGTNPGPGTVAVRADVEAALEPEEGS